MQRVSSRLGSFLLHLFNFLRGCWEIQIQCHQNIAQNQAGFDGCNGHSNWQKAPLRLWNPATPHRPLARCYYERLRHHRAAEPKTAFSSRPFDASGPLNVAPRVKLEWNGKLINSSLQSSGMCYTCQEIRNNVTVGIFHICTVIPLSLMSCSRRKRWLNTVCLMNC